MPKRPPAVLYHDAKAKDNEWPGEPIQKVVEEVVSEDDEWPAEPIREIIEEVASEDLEDGFYIEVINNRGVTSRGLTDGGQQERSLVDQYRRYAATAAIAWPRTAAMLNRIAGFYEREARDNDIRADLNEDLWR